MHKNNVCVIYDTDTKYAMKLMNVINSDKQMPFKAQIFTEKEQLTDYLDSYEPKVLMISEDVCDYDITKKHDSRLVVLCNEENQVDRTEEQFGEQAVGVYKYQSSKRILQKVIIQGQGDYKEVERKTRLTGIIGADVCCRNLLGIIMSYLLREKESILYVNLDEFSGLEHIFPDSQNANLSDAFYLYRQNGNHYCDEIRRTINHSEYFDYIAPVQCADDISYMNSVSVVQFLEEVGQELGYSRVIIDISCGVRESWHILEGCESVYTPESEHDWFRRKQNAMEQYFLQSGMGYLVDKMVKIPVRDVTELMTDDFWKQLAFSYTVQNIKKVLDRADAEEAF